jgi:quinolinate synthase
MAIEQEIRELKERRSAVILAHNYQEPEVQDIADFVGDSLDLSRKAAETDAPVIVFCGVRFMAETAKILSPDKSVYIPRGDAGCPMADMVKPADILALRAQYPKAAVVTYVNSSAEVKAESDIVCTSANAVKIVDSLPQDEIIFVPDKNLGAYCQSQTKKRIILFRGYCYVHSRITDKEVLAAKDAMPDALLLVHPECDPSVTRYADQILSTNGMLSFIKEAKAKRFLIATEAGIIHRMKKENPDKEFFTAGSAKICVNMKKTTLSDVRRSLAEGSVEITLPKEVMSRARRALDAMLAVR